MVEYWPRIYKALGVTQREGDMEIQGRRIRDAVGLEMGPQTLLENIPESSISLV